MASRGTPGKTFGFFQDHPHVRGWLAGLVMGLAPFGEGVGQPTAPVDPPTAPVAPFVAALHWRMPPRFELGWKAYKPAEHAYDRAYIDPELYEVTLDVCASRGGAHPVREITVDLRRERTTDVLLSRRLKPQTCTTTVFLPLGSYEATVKVVNRISDERISVVPLAVRDWLIVSLGDSLSSGEGNPDIPAKVKQVIVPMSAARPQLIELSAKCRQLDDEGTVGAFGLAEVEAAITGNLAIPLERAARWVDRRCHRSKTSGPALAAKAIEDSDPKSSVTFVSLACSGAKLSSGVLASYAGQEQVGDRESIPGDLRSQMEALRSIVGDRKIDALIVSAGINDVGMTDLVTLAATKHSNEEFPDIGPLPDDWLGEGARIYADGRAKLPTDLEEFADRIHRTVNVSEIYWLEYPTNVMRDGTGKLGGCGIFDFPAVGVSDKEIRILERLSDDLRLLTMTSAGRFGWNFVGGVFEAFERAGYCALGNRRLFVRYRESCLQQGHEDGMIHPNAKGHGRIADRLVSAIRLGPTPRPIKRLFVDVLSIEVRDQWDGSVDGTEVSIDMGIVPLLNNPVRPVTARVNQVVSVPESAGHFRYDVWAAPTLPRLPTQPYLLLAGSVPMHASAATLGPGDTAGGSHERPPPDSSRLFSIQVPMTPANQFGSADGEQMVREAFFRGTIEVRYRIRATVPPFFDPPAVDPEQPLSPQ